MAGRPAPRETVVHGSATRFEQTITVGRHRFLVDEPSELGGDDTGPSPYDLLLSALGAGLLYLAGVFG